MCFKVMANADVCGCATTRLEQEASGPDFKIYESVIARTLSQTNVPRNRAWSDALEAEALHQGVTVQALSDNSIATSTAHNAAIHACADAKPKG